MKITRQQLRKLIREASREFSVKTVSPEQYAKDASSLPPSMRDLATGPRATEAPKDKHVIGNFFMTKGVPYKPPRGYSSLNKNLNFYMVLPSGEAISIDNPGLRITKTAEGIRYLRLLDQHVTPMTLDSVENISLMKRQISDVIAMMKPTFDATKTAKESSDGG